MLLHRLQKTQRQLRVVRLDFHLGDCEPEVGIALPLRTVAFEFGDQATQLCNPVEKGASFSFRWHGTREFYKSEMLASLLFSLMFHASFTRALATRSRSSNIDPLEYVPPGENVCSCRFFGR